MSGASRPNYAVLKRFVVPPKDRKPKPPAERDPTIWRDELLPSGWHDIGEKLGLGDDEIYPAWTKFKDRTSQPFQRSKWQAWVKTWAGYSTTRKR